MDAKSALPLSFILLGVLMIALSVSQANQYFIQQATIEPSLQQLEQLGDLGGVNVEETRQLLGASLNAIIQTILMDLILGLIFLVAGFWLLPSEKAHAHHSHGLH